MVMEELWRKRVNGAKALLKVLEAQSHINFRDVITGDESWIFLNRGLNSIWIGAEETVPTRLKLIIVSKTAMLAIFAISKRLFSSTGLAGPVIQQRLLQSRSYHSTCNHALNRMAGK
jgi:hypothetical protein